MRVGVIFPGQGSQTVGMGVAAAHVYPAAMECFQIAKHILGYDLLQICSTGPESTLRETRYAQPAIFVANVALRSAVGSALEPVVSAGHSFGEYCSLTIAEAMSFETALALVNERGLAMHRAALREPGRMAAVLGLGVEPLRAALRTAIDCGGGRVALANFNAPGQIVISGDAEAVRRAGEAALAAGAKRVIPLNVAGAWHSELMASARADFERFVRDAAIVPPRWPVISNVDARPYTDVATIRDHLIRSVTDEVRWHETAVALVGMGLDLIVEFGASPVLAPMLKRVEGAPRALSVSDPGGVQKLQALLEPATI
jgi:[acyl-carrier-protein] S-malonyltransferase